MKLSIRDLRESDIDAIVAAFAGLGWHKPARLYRHYLDQQAAGRRTTLVALADATFAGYLTIDWQSPYPPFQADAIPEIQDLNVLPQFRRRGIATRLLKRAEREVARRAAVVGIGVGLYADYGAAQRLYVRRGFVPDGRGISYQNQPVAPGQSVRVDDALVLYFTKQLRQPR